MFCNNCGAQLPDDSVFCEECGANLAQPAQMVNAEQMAGMGQTANPGQIHGAGQTYGAPQMPRMPQSGAGIPYTGQGMQPFVNKRSILPVIIIAAVLLITAVVIGGVFAVKKYKTGNETGNYEKEADVLSDPEGLKDTAESEDKGVTNDFKEKGETEELPEYGKTSGDESDIDTDENYEDTDDIKKEEENRPATEDWFEIRGLSITPNGDFSFRTMANDREKDTGYFEVPARIDFEEKEYAEDPKMKTILINLEYDLSQMEKRIYTQECVFDRYTGITIGFNNKHAADSSENTSTREGFVRIDRGDQYYECSIEKSAKLENDTGYVTYTVVCPSDYDGLVIQVGYCSMLLSEKWDKIDYLSKLYRLDELGYYDSGEDYFYFSPSGR